jgi:hypothetical protein
MKANNVNHKRVYFEIKEKISFRIELIIKF